MEVKEAIVKAKEFIADVYADEHISNVGLEEIEHDERQKLWTIALSFSRPWNAPRTRAQEVLESMGGVSNLKRSVKVVSMTESGGLVSIKNLARAELAE